VDGGGICEEYMMRSSCSLGAYIHFEQVVSDHHKSIMTYNVNNDIQC